MADSNMLPYVGATMEARRLGMRGVWIYVVLDLLVAVSFTFPLFMSNREPTLAAMDGTSVGGTFKQGDVVGLLIAMLVVLAFTVWSFVL